MIPTQRTDLEGRTLATLDALGLPRETKKLAWEARARLTWGDRRVDVLDWLVGAGIDHATAELIVQTCIRERAYTLRVKGMRDLLVGGVLVGVAIGALLLIAFIVNVLHETMDVPGKVVGALWALCGLTGVVGGYFFIRGLERVIFGAHTEGAVSDVDEWG